MKNGRRNIVTQAPRNYAGNLNFFLSSYSHHVAPNSLDPQHFSPSHLPYACILTTISSTHPSLRSPSVSGHFGSLPQTTSLALMHPTTPCSSLQHPSTCLVSYPCRPNCRPIPSSQPTMPRTLRSSPQTHGQHACTPPIPSRLCERNVGDVEASRCASRIAQQHSRHHAG